MLTKAEGIHKILEDLKSDATPLARTTAAADEPASKDYNAQLTWNGQAGAFGFGADHIRLETLYVEDLIRALSIALHRIPEFEKRRQRMLEEAGETIL